MHRTPVHPIRIALCETAGAAIPMTDSLTIVVVEEDRDRALAIVDVLREAGDYEVP